MRERGRERVVVLVLVLVLVLVFKGEQRGGGETDSAEREREREGEIGRELGSSSHLRSSKMTSLCMPKSKMQSQSGIVIEDSAMFVARMTFIVPAGGGLKASSCSSWGTMLWRVRRWMERHPPGPPPETPAARA